MTAKFEHRQATTTHVQVPFVTNKGELVEVDEGLLPFLEQLRRHRVNTQFSCEGTDKHDHAYVLGDRFSFGRLMRNVWLNYRLGMYSIESEYVVEDFINTYRAHEFAVFKRDDWDTSYEFNFNKNGKHAKYKTGFSIEHSYSKMFGIRTTLRWPVDATPYFVAMLEETEAN